MSSTPFEQRSDCYEIRIQGRLDDHWSTWLDNLELFRTDDGITVLRGPVVDQAALHGLLHRLRDLGLPLLSVTRTDPTTPAIPARRPEPTENPPDSPRAACRRQP